MTGRAVTGEVHVRPVEYLVTVWALVLARQHTATFTIAGHIAAEVMTEPIQPRCPG